MPLPKIPTKPATILSQQDYPKAEKGKPVKPVMTLVEAPPPDEAVGPKARARSEDKLPAARTRSAKPKTVEAVKSSASRAADKMGVNKMFVLDTNVLMHDPTSLFRFEEHDVYLPMVTLE